VDLRRPPDVFSPAMPGAHPLDDLIEEVIKMIKFSHPERESLKMRE
jgi:hypothetical protein